MCVCGGGGGGPTNKKALTTFLFLVLNWGPKVISKKTILFHPTFSSGVQLLIPIETYRTCDSPPLTHS